MLRFILVFFFTHTCYTLLSQDSDSLKCWSSRDKLKWNDFKGEIPHNSESLNLNAVSACTLMPIAFRKDDLLSYHIRVLFERYKSWTTDTTSHHMLAHEQLHFDIAELYARKLRKAIREVSEAIQDPDSNDFDPVFQKLYVESGDLQKKYDKDTIHGLDKESQREWTSKIFVELEQLKDYASKLSDCK
jgi:hypothetical protein